MRTFRLFEDITSKCTKAFADFIGGIEGEEEITLEVMSYGGDVFSGLAIAELIDEARKRGIRSKTVIYGIAASAAAILSLATDHIVMTEAGSMMLHGVFCEGSDDVDDGIKRANEACLSIIHRRCPSYSMETLTSGDNWYSAEDAKKLGLIDEIRELSSFGNDVEFTNSALAMVNHVLREIVHAQSHHGGKKMSKMRNEEEELVTQVEEQVKEDEEKLENEEDIVVDDMDLKTLVVDGFNAILDKLAEIENRLSAPVIEAEGEDDEDEKKEDIMAAKIRNMYERIGKVSKPCVKRTRDEVNDSHEQIKASVERVKQVFPNISKFYND